MEENISAYQKPWGGRSCHLMFYVMQHCSATLLYFNYSVLCPCWLVQFHELTSFIINLILDTKPLVLFLRSPIFWFKPTLKPQLFGSTHDVWHGHGQRDQVYLHLLVWLWQLDFNTSFLTPLLDSFIRIGKGWVFMGYSMDVFLGEPHNENNQPLNQTAFSSKTIGSYVFSY